MYTKQELKSPEMSKKGIYPSRTGMNANNVGHIPSEKQEGNRRFRRSGVVGDKPGKIYVVGNTVFKTRLQVVGKKRIVHWDRKKS